MDKGIAVLAEIKEMNREVGFDDNVKVEVWYELPVNP
jgi:hypothetical protein